MGHRVCRLAARVAGAEVVGASRSARGPLGVAMQRADVRDSASVARLLLAGDLVVNCAGPFAYDAAPLVAACVAARAHYCDLADDVAFAQRVREAARSAGARAAGVFVCTGASTVPGLAGIFARAFISSPRAPEIARISAYLSVGSANPLSAGLFASLLAPLGRALPDGRRAFAELRSLSLGDGRTLRFGAYPAPFAEQRIAFGERHIPARFFFGFDRAPLTALLHLAAPAFAKLEAHTLRRIARGLLPLARAVSVLGTPRGVLAVVAEDASGHELARIALTASSRGLDIPAAPPAWLAARLAQGTALPSGAVELHALVPLADMVAWARGDAAYMLSSRGSVEL